MGQRAAPVARQTHTSDDKKYDWTRHSNLQGIIGLAGKYDIGTYRWGLSLGHSSSIHGLRLALPNQGLAQRGEDVIYVSHDSYHRPGKSANITSHNRTTMTMETSKGRNGHRLCRVLDSREDQACAKACAEAYLSDD